MPRPKGSKNLKKLSIDLVDNDLPRIIELPASQMDSLDGYKHQVKGRFWHDKVEIVCVLLLEKHK